MARVTDTAGSIRTSVCGAKKRDGEPCGAYPLKGATRCHRHGGSSPQAQAKAQERIIEENARGILGRIDPTAPKENPVEMLVTLIHAKGAEVAWLRSKVQALQDDELVWGLTEHKTGVGPEGPVNVETYKAEQTIWWKLLREAENQLANWITMALKAGVEERRVRVTESQGAAVAGALRRILDRLNLTPAQWSSVTIVVPEELRALSSLE